MPQGHVIDIMTYSSYSLQYYCFEKQTALVLLTYPTISAPKRDIPPIYLQMSGNVPEYVPILKTQ